MASGKSVLQKIHLSRDNPEKCQSTLFRDPYKLDARKSSLSKEKFGAVRNFRSESLPYDKFTDTPTQP